MPKERPSASSHSLDSVSYTHLDVYKRQALDVIHPETQEVIYAAGTLLGEDEVEKIDALGIDRKSVV